MTACSLPPRLAALLTGALAWAALLLAASSFASAADGPAGVEFFEAKIRPIFVKHCYECHGDKEQEAGLRLDTRDGWEKGGDSGRAVSPKKPNESLLIRMVRGGQESPPKMPPDYRLAKEEIAELVKWVELGAPDPREAAGVVSTAPQKQIDWEAAGKFWAFQPVAAAEPPPAKDPRFKQPIDRFVAAKLEAAKLQPLERADRWTLIRRATLDLTGLPPSIAEVEAFLADKSPEAFAKVIDRLLASSQYGEHQARFWLDLARYAEDQAHQEDAKEANVHAWRYRDWVIEALNGDMPYDRFLRLQLAADLIETDQDDPKHRAALGFFGLGAQYYKNTDIPKVVAEEWDDRIDTLTRSMLGLTVSCARCHDHKYDPIPTQDYYSLAGVIASVKVSLIPVAARAETQAFDAAKAKAATAEQAAKDCLQGECDRVATIKCDSLPEYTLAAWKWQRQKAEKDNLKIEEFAKGAGLDEKVLKGLADYLKRDRGQNHYLAKWTKFLPTKESPSEPTEEVRALAETFRDKAKENVAQPWMKRNLDQQNELFGAKGVWPLTEEVLVAAGGDSWKKEYTALKAAAKEATDRVPPQPAQAHGVVEDKPKDLKVYLRGSPYKLGEPAPRRFLRAVCGEERTAFTQGSGRAELAAAIVDPKNPLTARVLVNRLWQQHFGRGIVATASNFGKLGGRPTHPELLDYLATRFTQQGWSLKKVHREIMLSEAYQRSSASDVKSFAADPENQWLWRMSRRRLSAEMFRDASLTASGQLDRTPGGPSTNIDDLANVRRTVYGKVSRYDLSKLLRLFDFPDPSLTSDRRNETTLPQQQLFLLNSPFVLDRAKALAAKLANQPPEAQVRGAYAAAFSRPPSPKELAVVTAYLSAEDTPEEVDPKTKRPQNQLTRLERFTQSLLVSNEFMYID